ncbi:unnamed protein product, partial [marine sediment metagenome]
MCGNQLKLNFNFYSSSPLYLKILPQFKVRDGNKHISLKDDQIHYDPGSAAIF